MPGVTKEQIQAAREADLFAYLQFHEPGVLKRDGPNYRHKEHDSLVYVTGKRYWYWNSRGRSINALDYLIQIRGYGLVDAVHTLVGGERQLYEQYALGEVDLETYQKRKAVYDADLVQARNVHAAITAQTRQIQSDYEAKLKQREIVQEVGSADTLTQALIDRLISKVYIFPGDRIEIEYVTQDFLGISEPGKEV